MSLARTPSISTHVLDVARGQPASGIRVRLVRRDGTDWREVGADVTDADGRIETLLRDEPLRSGAYRLIFDTRPYLLARHGRAFHPEVTVAFEVSSADERYHVPLLLSPFGYTTYRGS